MSIGFGANGVGGLTQTAATVIQFLIQPSPYGRTRVRSMGYTDTGTAHTLTFLRPLGRTTVASAGATGQAVVNMTADPGVAAAYGGISNGIAANDFVAIRTASDGVTRLYKVSSVSTLAITMTANLTVAVAAGDDVWFFGITTDTDGRFGYAHPKYLGGAGSALVSFPTAGDAVLAGTWGNDEPILVNSNNATNAGTFSSLTWDYSQA